MTWLSLILLGSEQNYSSEAKIHSSTQIVCLEYNSECSLFLEGSYGLAGLQGSHLRVDSKLPGRFQVAPNRAGLPRHSFYKQETPSEFEAVEFKFHQKPLSFKSFQ